MCDIISLYHSWSASILLLKKKTHHRNQYYQDLFEDERSQESYFIQLSGIYIGIE